MATARIHDLTTASSYIAHSADDCRDSVDRSAYESAVELNDVISMGCMIVELLANTESDPTFPEAA